MKILVDEILRRFPEIESCCYSEDFAELPHAVMSYVVSWLNKIGENGFERSVVERLVDFKEWCELQPRGETASDDIWTTYIVSMVEGLFLQDRTKCLVPHVMTKEMLESNEQYFVAWVGRENYDKALGEYPR